MSHNLLYGSTAHPYSHPFHHQAHNSVVFSEYAFGCVGSRIEHPRHKGVLQIVGQRRKEILNSVPRTTVLCLPRQLHFHGMICTTHQKSVIVFLGFLTEDGYQPDLAVPLHIHKSFDFLVDLCVCWV